jgi:NADPH2:quinone reductase
LVLMAGRSARPELPVGPFYSKCCRIYGFVMFSAAPESQRRAAERINRWLASEALTAKIDRVATRADVVELHRLQEDNTLNQAGVIRGKIVVKM